jgi:hypothetical protein
VNGKDDVPGLGEWIMNPARIPVAEYEKLAQQWNPTQFDAECWGQMAQDADMKCILITSKHYGGFVISTPSGQLERRSSHSIVPNSLPESFERCSARR